MERKKRPISADIGIIQKMSDISDKSDIIDISDTSEIDMDTSTIPFPSPDHSKLGSKPGPLQARSCGGGHLFKFSKTTRDPPKCINIVFSGS